MEVRSQKESLFAICNENCKISYPTWYDLFSQPVLRSIKYSILPIFGIPYSVIMRLPQDYKAITSISKPMEVDARNCTFIQPLCVSI